MAAAEKILSDYRSALDKDFADYQSSEIRLADMEVKTETTRIDKETNKELALEQIKLKSNVWRIAFSFFPKSAGFSSWKAIRTMVECSPLCLKLCRRFSASILILRKAFMPSMTRIIPNTPKG